MHAAEPFKHRRDVEAPTGGLLEGNCIRLRIVWVYADTITVRRLNVDDRPAVHDAVDRTRRNGIAPQDAVAPQVGEASGVLPPDLPLAERLRGIELKALKQPVDHAALTRWSWRYLKIKRSYFRWASLI
jgi:hypothetical protein